jgi:2-aminomuconate deaminase
MIDRQPNPLLTSIGLIVEGAAAPRGKYPHLRQVGPWLFVSGTSSRRPDGTIEGATADPDGTVKLDAAAQTRAVLTNMQRTLSTVGASLDDVVDLTTFLVDMNDFEAYNTVYATFFGDSAPARTTVAVHQLPHPHLAIEIKATAYRPESE